MVRARARAMVRVQARAMVRARARAMVRGWARKVVPPAAARLDLVLVDHADAAALVVELLKRYG